MAIKEGLLREFDNEMANTRKMLERIPEDKFAWQPHAKSMTLGALALHLASIPAWASTALSTDAFDLDAEHGNRPQQVESREALLAQFDLGIATTRAAIAAASDEAMLQIWSMRKGDQVLFSMPRIAV